MTPTLHPAIGKNRYCGPAAMACLLGITTDEAARTLRVVTGKRAIYGVRPADLRFAILRHGLGLVELPTATHRSMRDVLTEKASAGYSGVYLLFVTGHYVVARVEGGSVEVCDNRSVYPLPLARYRKPGVHVRQVWRVQ